MVRSRVVLAAFLCSFSGPLGAHRPATQPETPHLRFVTEYVRELAEVQEIRDDFERDTDPAKNPNVLSVSSYSFTRMTLELKSQVRILGAMRLNNPYDFLIPSITALYEKKIRIFQRLLDDDREMLEGPKSGVDYSKVVSETPELRAKLDDTDHTLWEATPAVFMTLIDPKPDSQNHVSHLVITCAERSQLIDQINASFGDKLSEHNRPYGVGIALILRDALLNKGHKCSDEPWD
jgi:hypothetical protein